MQTPPADFMYVYLSGVRYNPAINCSMSQWYPSLAHLSLEFLRGFLLIRSAWSACSASCGPGTQQRTRTVLMSPEFGGVPCENTTDISPCNGSCCTNYFGCPSMLEPDSLCSRRVSSLSVVRLVNLPRPLWLCHSGSHRFQSTLI